MSRKCKNDNEYSLCSLSKKSNNDMTQLGVSITKHADLMVAGAKMAAIEQEKNRRDGEESTRDTRQFIPCKDQFAVSLK